MAVSMLGRLVENVWMIWVKKLMLNLNGYFKQQTFMVINK
jgi:hypothetical protein